MTLFRSVAWNIEELVVGGLLSGNFCSVEFRPDVVCVCVCVCVCQLLRRLFMNESCLTCRVLDHTRAHAAMCITLRRVTETIAARNNNSVSECSTAVNRRCYYGRRHVDQVASSFRLSAEALVCLSSAASTGPYGCRPTAMPAWSGQFHCSRDGKTSVEATN